MRRFCWWWRWCWWRSARDSSPRFRSEPMPRARSESAHLKVLEAAIELVAAHGVDATSMDAIARRSGVSKATIYKHWKDKDALLLELLGHITGIHKRPTF